MAVNLKFFRVSALPTDGVKGGIYFNETDQTINVCTGTGAFEKYAGKLLNATWDDASKKLVLEKADGSSIEVNLSDVASATTLADVVTRLAAAEGEIDTLQSEMDAVEAKAAANEAAIGVLNGAADEEGSVAKAVADAEARVKETTDAISEEVNGLKTTVSDNSAAIEALQGAVGEGGSVSSQITEEIAKLDATVGSQAVAEGKHVAVEVVEVDGKLTGLTVTESDIASAAALSAEVTRATAAEEANAASIATEKGRVDTLVGEDANKSVRTIANEELAKQLIAEGAAESLDTLEEIAKWIQEHPEDASAMNSAIQANTTAIAKLNGDAETEGSVAAAAADALADAEAYTDEREVEIDKKWAAADATVLSDAKTYADTKVNELANGQVSTNTTDIASIKEQISGINTTIEENEKTTSEALTDLDSRLGAIESGTVASVSGSDYIDVTGTSQVTVSAKVGSLDYATDTVVEGLALTSAVKAYVEAALSWAEFDVTE